MVDGILLLFQYEDTSIPIRTILTLYQGETVLLRKTVLELYLIGNYNLRATITLRVGRRIHFHDGVSRELRMIREADSSEWF